MKGVLIPSNYTTTVWDERFKDVIANTWHKTSTIDELKNVTGYIKIGIKADKMESITKEDLDTL